MFLNVPMISFTIIILAFLLGHVQEINSVQLIDVGPLPIQHDVLTVDTIINDKFVSAPPNCTFNDTVLVAADNDRLECFLWYLRVDIPEQSFQKDWIKITIRDMVCTNFQVVDLKASSSASSSSSSNHSYFSLRDITSELNISVRKISATCQGRYSSTGGVHGNVVATVAETEVEASSQQQKQQKKNHEALAVKFKIEGSGERRDTKNNSSTNRSNNDTKNNTTKHTSATSVAVPRSLRTVSCTTNLYCQRIHFSGSLSAKLIQVFSQSVSQYITDTLQRVCSLLPKTVDPIVTAYLQRFDTFVEQYLPSSPASPSSSSLFVLSSEGKKSLDENNIITTTMMAMQGSQSNRRSTYNKYNKNTTNTTHTSTNLVEFPVISGLLNFINEQLRYHLQTSWIPLLSPLTPLTSFSYPAHDEITTITTKFNNKIMIDSKYNEHTHIPDYCVDVFRGLSGLLKRMIGQTPVIHLPPYFRNIVIPVPDEVLQDATVVLNISQLSIQGLDRMNVFQLFEPYHINSTYLETRPNIRNKRKSNITNTTISTMQTKLISIKGFIITVPIILEIFLPTSSSSPISTSTESIITSSRLLLKESFQITANITEVNLTLSTLIQVVDWDSISLPFFVDAVQRFIQSRDLHDLGCIFDTLKKVEIEEWIMNNVLIDTIELSQNHRNASHGSSLDADLDQTINAVVRLFLDDYSNLWTLLARGLLHGPGTHAINRFIADWINNYSTKTDGGERIHDSINVSSGNNSLGNYLSPILLSSFSDEQSTPKWLNFTKFEILNIFNEFLENSDTKRNLNQFLYCISERFQIFIGGDKNSFHDDNTSMLFTDYVSTMIRSGLRNVEFENIIENSGTNRRSQLIIAVNDKDNDNKTLNKMIRLSGVEAKNWNSLQQLQIMQPSGDTKLLSSLVLGKVRGKENDRLPMLSTNESATPINKDPPQVTLIIDVDGYKVSGEINLTFFLTLEAQTEIKIDYDLNRLQNLTLYRIFEEINCVLVPAIEVRLMPTTTGINFGEFGVNLTASIAGKNFSLSSDDYSQLFHISNDVLHWTGEFSRSFLNYVIEKWVGSSLLKCPGIVAPANSDTENPHSQNLEGNDVYWLWKNSTHLWIIFGLIVFMQVGLLFILRLESNDDKDSNVDLQIERSSSSNGSQLRRPSNAVIATSHESPLLSSYEELMIDPVFDRRNSIDNFIFRDIYEDEFNDEDEHHVILEDQSIESYQIETQTSIFQSVKIPELVRYLIPTLILGTIILFVSSNSSVGASVDFSVEAGTHSIGIPSIFEFSLMKTVTELYRADVYPLLILVVCFSGVWPYIKVRRTLEISCNKVFIRH